MRILLIALLATPVLAETEAEVQTRFLTETITFDFKKAGINEVCEFLHRETRIAFRPSPALQEQVLEGGYRMTAKLKSVPVATALRLLTTTHNLKLHWGLEGYEMLLADEAPRELLTREIDLSELILPVDDFAGPKIGIPEEETQTFG